MADSKITGFEKLRVWQEAQEIAVTSYQLTEKFPSAEKYSLVDQIKRSSSSVSANIAEGFGRQSDKENIQFYSIAYGSLLETKSHLYLATKLQYLNEDDLKNIFDEIMVCQKQLSSLIKVIKNAYK